MPAPKNPWERLRALQENFRRQKETAGNGEMSLTGGTDELDQGGDMDSSAVPTQPLLAEPDPGPVGYNLQGAVSGGEAPTRPYHIKAIRSKNLKSPTGYSWSVNQVFDDQK